MTNTAKARNMRIAARKRKTLNDGEGPGVNVLFSSDRDGEPTFTKLEPLVLELSSNGSFETAYTRSNETDLRDELASRGWYEGNNEHGRYLVLNLDILGLRAK